MLGPRQRTAPSGRHPARSIRPLAVLGGLAGALVRLPIGRFLVEGPSMEPAFRAGDRVLVNRLAYLWRAPAAGDVVVLRDPERSGHYLLKRIARTPEAHSPGPPRFYVLGDNAASSRDSRSFGSVERRQIVGRAWLVY